jgi:hypothetical protein
MDARKKIMDVNLKSFEVPYFPGVSKDLALWMQGCEGDENTLEGR